MKDSLHHERTFLLYEGLKVNVCLYCDCPLSESFSRLCWFAENDLVIMQLWPQPAMLNVKHVKFGHLEDGICKERYHPAANSLRFGETIGGDWRLASNEWWVMATCCIWNAFRHQESLYFDSHPNSKVRSGHIDWSLSHWLVVVDNRSMTMNLVWNDPCHPSPLLHVTTTFSSRGDLTFGTLSLSGHWQWLTGCTGTTLIVIWYRVVLQVLRILEVLCVGRGLTTWHRLLPMLEWKDLHAD